MQDAEFLALLVHRGHLNRAQANALVEEIKSGAPLDALLEDEIGWTSAEIEKLRRTRAGEIPEIPGMLLRERVGTGGTADVFLAREKKTGRVLALKVLKPDATRHAPTRKAFIAEARLLERLSHPGLVKCLGVARSAELYFTRLEYIEGCTLLERLDEGEPLEEGDALGIVIEVAEALRYLEEQGVVHRDIKPGNIMLSKKGRVVLIDLGFAAAGGQAAESDDTTAGTVAYLSPEQARGGASADIRSDIYSLGISLFHLVLGRLPFESSDDREVLRMQVMESLSSPELKGRGFSPHLHYFIEKMVAKDADDRYQDWSELIADIREQLDGRDDLDFSNPARGRKRG